MVGTIILHELEVNCMIGIYAEEREITQQLFLDIEVDYDFELASKTENIHDTLDYTVMATALANLLKTEKFQLIETAAERCCDLILKKWPEALTCRLKIRKPAAVPEAKYAAVAIERLSKNKKATLLKAASSQT